MNYVDVNNIIEKFSIGKRKYEEKKAKKLGYTSFYNYILDKVEGPKSEIFNEEKIQIIQSSNNKTPPKARLNILLENYKNGRYEETEKLAVSITKDFPEYFFGWKVLGAVLGVLDRNSEAINAIQKVITLSPQDHEAHNNMGVTLKELGRLDEAESSYNQAIALKPDYAEAFSNLGVTLQELDRLDEAEASYNKAISLKPNYADAHYNLGLTLQQIGRLDEAETSYNKAIALKPNFFQAFTNLGIILQQMGRLEEAEASYNQAISLKPNFAKAYCNLGVTLKELGRLDEAEASFNQAIELKPDYAEAYLNLCELLENMNRADELLSFIRGISRKNFEKKADFLYYEALIEFQKENYETATKIVEKININELLINRQPLAFKLKGDIYHHKKKYKEAFQAYKSKNKRVKESLEYKKQNSEKYFSKQLENVNQIEQLQKISLYKSVIEPNWIQPTFLIGFPRSGTTLLDTILRTHTNINVLEEQPMMEKVYASFRDIPTISTIEAMDNSAVETAVDIYFQELKKHTKVDTKQVLVDKLPLNILQLPLINQVFPNAKYIICLRHPFDCVLSCWMQNFRLNPAMANMIELERIVDFYDVVMRILKLSKERYSLNTHRIRYEDLVLNFEENVSNLLIFLDLKWEEELKNYQKTALARDRIYTPSSSQVIKPIYQTASYRWKHYEEYLEQYKERLTPWIQRYGY